MRYRVVALFLGVLSVLAPCGFAAAQESPKNDVKGLFLMTDFPAVSVRPGTTSTVNLRLQNYDLPPERLAVSVAGVPSGWTATLVGGGQPIAAAMPGTNASVTLELRLDVPKDAPVGTTNLTVSAKGGTNNIDLPIAITLAKDLPAKLTVTPQLPDLRGNAKSSFEYQLSIKNDSGKKLIVALAAEAPQNFDATYTEQYGSQELSAVPIDAGQSKDVKLKVRPPSTVAAGKYKVTARVAAEDANVTTELGLEVNGQPKIDVSGREGVLSAKATAGKDTVVPIVLTNSGDAAAEDISLSGTTPTGWKVVFDPKSVDKIAPNDTKEVQATITPPEKAVAGDYQTTLRANWRGDSAASTFRVTVATSSMWGIVGIGIIGAALLVLVGAVARFGRR
ncbi:MAG TPA: NEW3 domain-containing protein [Xanthobacteraceae bacterium]|jgi:uncharacterized membrane protein|nr:NEW3 domain-containing protein [Xanthobacteraceae bacterium]